MEIDAKGMKTFISIECFIPVKGYVSVWVCMDVILLETKLALGRISLFTWYQRYQNFLK
jgi:hypothetical protein